jgi:formate hydrogenlyase subunit 4
MEVLLMSLQPLIGYMITPLIALIFAPLLPGIINKTKAFFAGRKGPPLIQPYYDILRLFRKGSVYSRSTSWIFRIAPVIIFATTLAATFFIPIVLWSTPLVIPADLIIILYLFGLGRFFLILSALDTASPFEGMGASREAFFSAIVEPVAMICFLNVMRTNHAGSVGVALCSASVVTDSISVILSAIPLFIVLLAENARIPVDDPNTHLELTMIHEVMILDNSGTGLALMEYAAAVKLWFFSLVIGRILLPPLSSNPNIQTGCLLLLIVMIAVTIGVVESIMARWRLVKVPQMLCGAGVVALLGFFVSATGALSW